MPSTGPEHVLTQVEIPVGDVRLRADVLGDPAGPAAVLLHGGGQTRHSWRRSAVALAAAGYHAFAVDLRGHGESDWSPDGVYGLGRYADDVARIVDFVGRPPVLIGASLGGNASLAALGDHPRLASALVLVDVSPYLQPSGTGRIRAFMAARSREGFGSLEEAAEAIAAYQPHRARPSSLDGLRKNLRRVDDRWFWHWDPAFLGGYAEEPVTRAPVVDQARLGAAAASLRIPTLLIRGSESDVLSREDADRFLDLVPHAELATVADAHHMVAGDDNSVFDTALMDFLDRRLHPRLAQAARGR